MSHPKKFAVAERRPFTAPQEGVPLPRSEKRYSRAASGLVPAIVEVGD